MRHALLGSGEVWGWVVRPHSHSGCGRISLPAALFGDPTWTLVLWYLVWITGCSVQSYDFHPKVQSSHNIWLIHCGVAAGAPTKASFVKELSSLQISPDFARKEQYRYSWLLEHTLTKDIWGSVHLLTKMLLSVIVSLLYPTLTLELENGNCSTHYLQVFSVLRLI